MYSAGRRRETHQNIYFILMLSVVFFMPVYGRVLPPLILLLCLNWLIEGTWYQTIKLLFREKKRGILFSFSLLYLLYVAGLSYSSNMDYGLFDLEVKLSLFIFPLIFATNSPFYLAKKKSDAILSFFVAGCLVSSLILYSHALYGTIVAHTAWPFYYKQLSWSHHPSYLAMYFTFAIAILACRMIDRTRELSFYALTGMLMLGISFFVFIVLLNSKAGLIGMFLVIFSSAGYLVLKKRSWWLATGTVTLAVILFLFCMAVFPGIGTRVKESEQDLKSMDSPGKDPKSTAERIAVWKCAIEIISGHPIIGVGTGDIKDALMEQYKAHNLIKIMNQKLDAHNQYLQTFCTLGILGLATLLYLLIFPTIRAFQRKEMVYLLFVAIFAINILVESMLENQAGVVFFALFNGLLFTFRTPSGSTPVAVEDLSK